MFKTTLVLMLPSIRPQSQILVPSKNIKTTLISQFSHESNLHFLPQ
jgi:hypothetical protein